MVKTNAPARGKIRESGMPLELMELEVQLLVNGEVNFESHAHRLTGVDAVNFACPVGSWNPKNWSHRHRRSRSSS